MKFYTGTKQLLAEPMTRGEYNTHRGWTLPADENPADEGYHVVYSDGYQSWSPKQQFEEAYLELPGIENLAPHQTRVVAEKVALDAKIVKLSTFIAERGDVFLSLDVAEQTRLVMQHTVMSQYSQLLGQRIANFEVQS